jgi:cytochrome P450
MASPLAGLPDELAGHQVRQGAPSPVLPNGPGYPRFVQAWLWLKKPTWFLDRCSRAYGDVFTMRLPFGINLVHIGRPELVKAVFGGDSDVLRAGEANATILEPLVGPHSVLVLDGPEHLRQRKLILPAFHGDRMRAWEAAVRDITRAEIARWPVGKPFALRPSMQSITLDVIVQVVFGVETSARRDELRRHILAVTGLGRNPLVLFATRDRRLGSHSPWARFIRARDALHAALVSEIRQRRDAPDLEQRGDVLSQLLLARDDESRAMTDDEVRDELVTLLFAGHETTATSLAWAFDLLLHHPRALSSLVAELDRGASEYLDATIMETLRVRPVVALVDRHVRQAIGIGGHTIPAGVIACPNIYLVQRRADLYQDPAAFRPDRFVGQTPPAFRLVSFRWRHPAVPGCQLRHFRDADRPSRGAARRDAAPGLTAARPGPPGGRDVRPSQWRALRRDRLSGLSRVVGRSSVSTVRACEPMFCSSPAPLCRRPSGPPCWRTPST